MMLNDVACVARTLRKSPAFTLTAALTLALGIGASTAIFSVANAVLLRPLPYKDPERLVVGYVDLHARNDNAMPMSAENFADLRNGSKVTFEDIAAVSTGRTVVIREDGTPEQVRLGRVTTNFFRLIGAKIVLGRDFEASDGEAQPQQPPPVAGAPPQQGPPPLPQMVILSYEYWQRRYGGDTGVIGRHLQSGVPFGQQIVGVLAPRFELFFQPKDQRRDDA